MWNNICRLVHRVPSVRRRRAGDEASRTKRWRVARARSNSSCTDCRLTCPSIIGLLRRTRPQEGQHAAARPWHARQAESPTVWRTDRSGGAAGEPGDVGGEGLGGELEAFGHGQVRAPEVGYLVNRHAGLKDVATRGGEVSGVLGDSGDSDDGARVDVG